MASADFKPVIDSLLAEAETAFGPLTDDYKPYLAQYRDEAADVLRGVVAGDWSAADAQESLKSLTTATRSRVAQAGLDAADALPEFLTAVVEKVLPLALKIVLA